MAALPALVWHKALCFLDLEDIARARLAHGLFRQASRGYHTARADLVGPRSQLDFLAGLYGLQVLRLRVDGGNHALVREVLRGLTARPRLLELRIRGFCSEELAALVYGWEVEGHTDVVADGIFRLHLPAVMRPPARTLTVTAAKTVLTGCFPGVRRLVEQGLHTWPGEFCRLPDLEEAVAAGVLADAEDPPPPGDWSRAPIHSTLSLDVLTEAAPGLRTLVWGKMAGPLAPDVALAARGFPHLRELRLFCNASLQSLLPAPLRLPPCLEVLQLAAERRIGLVELELEDAPRLTRLVLWWVPMALPLALPALRELDVWDARLAWTPTELPPVARARFGGPPESPMGRYAVGAAAGGALPTGFQAVRGYSVQGCPCVELQRRNVAEER